MSRVKSLVLTAALIAVGAILPMAFHAIPKGGNIFLPMHIPVLLCGFICGPLLGLFAGVATPVISAFATGMPPMTVLPGMACELACYGFATGIFIRIIKTKYKPLNFYLSLIAAMLIGRAVSGFVNGVIISLGSYTFQAWLTASFALSLPGIVIQLLLIPQLLYALEKSGLFQPDVSDLWGVGSLKNVKRCKDYFNSVASSWDAKEKITPDRLSALMDFVGIEEGDRILDVGCGTGIIDALLIEKGASSVTALDVAEEMIKIASEKKPSPKIEYIAADFYSFEGKGYDKAVVFNAFPHFTDRAAFASKLASALKDGGTFAIIHSASPSVINSFHTGIKRISKRLRPATEESLVFNRYFDVVTIVDDGQSYLIKGVKKVYEAK